jgi:hypothetical protein
LPALLHDIGAHISYTGHHKHSHYLVKNGDLRGFEPEEIAVIALITRYHRKTPPKKTHEEFAALRPKLRDTVRHLSRDPAAGRNPGPEPFAVHQRRGAAGPRQGTSRQTSHDGRRRAGALGRASSNRTVRGAGGQARPRERRQNFLC